MRRNLSTRRLRQEKLLCYLARDPVLHVASCPLFLPLSIFVHVYEHLYTYVSQHIYARQTSLGITHVTLHYLVPSTRAVPQLFSNNRPRSVLIPPGLSRSPLSVRTHVSHAAQRGKLLLSFRGITLVATYPTLSPCVLLLKSRQPGTNGDLPLAPLDCFRRSCISKYASVKTFERHTYPFHVNSETLFIPLSRVITLSSSIANYSGFAWLTINKKEERKIGKNDDYLRYNFVCEKINEWRINYVLYLKYAFCVSEC